MEIATIKGFGAAAVYLPLTLLAGGEWPAPALLAIAVGLLG